MRTDFAQDIVRPLHQRRALANELMRPAAARTDWTRHRKNLAALLQGVLGGDQ
jgi:hypothetical protein